jgi:transposase-like protein
MIAHSWRRNWEEVLPFFHYPQEIRTMIYTTNALESVNMRIRKTIKNRGHFPSDEAAIKLIYLALRNTMLKWKSSPLAWPEAARQFAISFGERFKK